MLCDIIIVNFLHLQISKLQKKKKKQKKPQISCYMAGTYLFARCDHELVEIELLQAPYSASIVSSCAWYASNKRA